MIVDRSTTGNIPGNSLGLRSIDLQSDGMAQEASGAPPVYPAYRCTADQDSSVPMYNHLRMDGHAYGPQTQGFQELSLKLNPDAESSVQQQKCMKGLFVHCPCQLTSSCLGLLWS